MRLQGALEENVLTILCWHPVHAPDLTLRLRPELFSSRTYRRIAETAFEYIAKYSQPPGRHLPDLMEDALRKGEEGKLLNQTIDAMDRLYKEIQADYVMAEIDHFVRKREMTMALEAASEALQQDDLQKAQDALYEQNVITSPHTPGIWLTDAPRMLSVLDQHDDDFISCGVDALDDRGVHLEPKTMTVLIAPPKRGKSWWLIEVGKRALMHGKSVLHITLENSEQLTARRYMQALFSMTKDKAQQIRSAVFIKDEQGYPVSVDFNNRMTEGLKTTPRARLARRLRGFSTRARFLIKEFPTATLSIPSLNAYLDVLSRQHNFRPDVLLIDYPDLMAIDKNNLRVALGQTFQQLRGIFVARNIAGATVTQGGRVASTAHTVTSNMVAEDFSKIATADTILTYSQSMEERRAGIARIMVAEARDAEDKWIAAISQNYATGQFCLDSAFLTEVLEKELNRVTGASGEADEEVHKE